MSAALVSGVLPQTWFGGTRNAYVLWALEFLAFVAAALVVRRRHRDVASRRRATLLATVALWLIAPLAGAAGILLLRLPLLQLAALNLAQRSMLFRSARSFPAEIS